MAEVDYIQTTIAINTAISPEVDIGNKSPVGLVLPAAWVAAAGGISLQASVDGGLTWNEVTTVAGAPYAIAFTAAGAAYIAIDPTSLRGISALKIRSGTAAAPVNQTAAVSLTLVTRLVF
jgi:hypothetical protein